MNALKIAAGVLIVSFALREVFQDLFHPARVGSLSDFVGRTVFRAFRHRSSTRSLAGPLSLVIVIFSWALLQAVGFALIYWAAFPSGFRLGQGGSASAEHGFTTMLYFSLQVITTLGLGDLVPIATPLRFLMNFLALSVFALLTASVSWVVLLYPALGRMRTLARRASILAAAEQKTSVDIVSGNEGFLIGDLALDVIRTRVDLIHFPIIYYFHSDQPRASLAHSLPYLVRLAEVGAHPTLAESVRLASATLSSALDDLAEVLRDRLLATPDRNRDAIFHAYAKEHVTRTSKP
jgi:hypothetical protein